MIVTCERCATQFQLDDTRIPAGGVRVRCSRCKHAFEILPPEPAAPERAGDSPHDDEESDWQFNQDVPSDEQDGPAVEAPAGGGVVDSLLGGSEEEDGDGDESSGLELDREGAEAEIDIPDSESLEEPDPLSAAADDEPPDLFGPPAGGGSAAPFVQPAAPAAPEPEPEPELKIDPPVFETEIPEVPPSEDPSDWDVLGGGDDKRPGSSREVPDLGAPSAKVPAGVAIDPGLGEDAPRWQAWIARGGNAVGWVVVIALFAFGLRGGLFPTAIAAPEALDLGRGLEVRDLSGRYVDHLAEGPIYVVSGRLVNRGSGTVQVPWLAVSRSGGGGSAAVPVPVAVPYAAHELREASLDALTAGRALASAYRSMRPGEERAFEAVLGPVADAPVDFRIVEGSPPKPQPPATASASTDLGSPDPDASGSEARDAATDPAADASAARDEGSAAAPAAPAPE